MLGSIDRHDNTIKTAITYLKHKSRDSWPQLLENWSLTHAFRRKIILDTRPSIQCEVNKIQQDRDENSDEDEEEDLVDEYIKKWDVLKLPNGYLLVSILRKILLIK